MIRSTVRVIFSIFKYSPLFVILVRSSLVIVSVSVSLLKNILILPFKKARFWRPLVILRRKLANN